MSRNSSYRNTIRACFAGYVVQAVINNFAPLLFVAFQTQYGISLSRIALLVSVNFLFQVTVDLIASPIVDRIGTRASMILAHGFCAAGLVCLSVLPELLPSPFAGLLISVMIYAVGGGLLEVLVSPVVEACPTENKASVMSLLHSFYCWGSVAVILLSTVFFICFGVKNWRILALFWALLPILNGLFFLRLPLPSLLQEGEKGLTLRQLLSSRIFWLLFVLMLCSGASEQSVSQWASAFAEKGLRISKTLGDLMGPMFFSVLMGSSRLLYAKLGHRLSLRRFMLFSGVLCVAGYLLVSLSPHPALSLLGCGICGFSVGIMWPGTFSLASRGLPRGGTLMFALLAFSGDIGCSFGPGAVGFLSSAFSGNLKAGILCAVIFPALLVPGILFYKSTVKSNVESEHTHD